MKLPHMSAAAETLHGEFGLYHHTRLMADPETADLATTFEQAQTRLKERIEQHDAARANTMTRMAVRDGLDAKLDEEVRTFFLAVCAKANNSRKSPLYDTYFPSGAATVTGAPLEIELSRVGAILGNLANETDPELKAHAEPLQAPPSRGPRPFLSPRLKAPADRIAANPKEANGFGAFRVRPERDPDQSANWQVLFHRAYRGPAK